MPTIFVCDLPEFAPVTDGARASGYTVRGPSRGYWRIEHEREIRLERKPLGLGPALWNTALAGGIRGQLVQFDANVMVLRGEPS